MINNIAVIYKSKYGTTKRYAEWIAEELEIPIFEASKIKPAQLANYDVIIYGGGLYAGGIIGSKLVAENPCKSLVVFTVGLANPANTDYTDILNKNFTQELLSKIKVFHLRGGVDYKKLSIVHKSMMSLLKRLVFDKKPLVERTDEDSTFAATYGKKVVFTDRSTIMPLIDYVRSL